MHGDGSGVRVGVGGEPTVQELLVLVLEGG